MLIIIGVRLRDGSSSYEGKVEVFIQGEWGYVCPDDFDNKGAEVVCRELGAGGKSYAPHIHYMHSIWFWKCLHNNCFLQCNDETEAYFLFKTEAAGMQKK